MKRILADRRLWIAITFAAINIIGWMKVAAIVERSQSQTPAPVAAEPPPPPALAVESIILPAEAQFVPPAGSTPPPDIITQAPLVNGGSSPFAVKFNQPMAPDDTVNLPLDEPLISFEPKIAGHCVWPDNDTLEFRSDEPFSRATEYTAVVLKGITGLLGTPLDSDVICRFTMPRLALKDIRQIALSSGGELSFELLFNDPVDAAVLAECEATGEPLPARTRRDLRAKILDELVPVALTTATRTLVVLDPLRNLLVLDTPSQSRADAVLGLLRRALGSLRAHPLSRALDGPGLARALADWADDPRNCPESVIPLWDLQLTTGESGDAIRVRGELTPEQLRTVGHGRLVSHLRLQWRDALDVTLSADAVLRRIQFGEFVLAGIDADTDDSAAGLASAQLAHTLPWVVGICAWLRAQFAAEQPQHAPPPAAAGVEHGERVH